MIKPLKVSFWDPICTIKGSVWATTKMKAIIFLGINNKSRSSAFRKPLFYQNIVPSSGTTLNGGMTLNSHTFSMETHWLVSITAMLQVVFVLDWSLKASAPHSRNLLNVHMTFELLFMPEQQFWNKKLWCFETKLWSKFNFSQYFNDVQQPLFDLCMSQIVRRNFYRRNFNFF